MTELLSIACGVAFIATVMMHITRKNTSLVSLYVIQSFAAVVFLGAIANMESDRILTVVALLTLIIKVIIAPYFFFAVIKRSKVFFSSGAYIGIPLSLVGILVLLFLSTKLIIPFLSGVALGTALPVILYPILIAGILISLFFIVNHHDVFAQIVGVLSLENWIMQTGIAVGVKQALLLEVGITFSIGVWIIIAIIFITRLHQNFGTLHVQSLTHLKED